MGLIKFIIGNGKKKDIFICIIRCANNIITTFLIKEASSREGRWPHFLTTGSRL